jgi:hypothetical protein
VVLDEMCEDKDEIKGVGLEAPAEV